MYRLSKQPLSVKLESDEVQKTLNFVKILRQNKAQNNVTDRMFDLRNTSEGIDVIGYLGEVSVAKVLGLDIDTTIFKYGDTGHDLRLNKTSIQVKTSSYPTLMFNSSASFSADVAILSQFIGRDRQNAEDDPHFQIWGWIERSVFLQLHYKRDYGYGTRLAMDAVQLHSLDSLIEEALGLERRDMHVRS